MVRRRCSGVRDGRTGEPVGGARLDVCVDQNPVLDSWSAARQFRPVVDRWVGPCLRHGPRARRGRRPWYRPPGWTGRRCSQWRGPVDRASPCQRCRRSAVAGADPRVGRAGRHLLARSHRPAVACPADRRTLPGRHNVRGGATPVPATQPAGTDPRPGHRPRDHRARRHRIPHRQRHRVHPIRSAGATTDAPASQSGTPPIPTVLHARRTDRPPTGARTPATDARGVGAAGVAVPDRHAGPAQQSRASQCPTGTPGVPTGHPGSRRDRSTRPNPHPGAGAVHRAPPDDTTSTAVAIAVGGHASG